MTGSNWFGYGPLKHSEEIRAFEVIFTSRYFLAFCVHKIM